MQLCLTLFIVIYSFNARSQEDQRIAGKWAYYGEKFYKILKSNKNFERRFFNKLFNENHASQQGHFDEITQRCEPSQRCYRHVSVGYDRARKIMFGELDAEKDSKGTYVVDVYCGKKFYYKSLDEVSRMHTLVNIEHTWPQSKFNGNYPKNMQKSDMHHLFLTDSRANSIRGNNPFGIVGQHSNRMWGEGCGRSLFGVMRPGAVYTPPAEHRGNVARALFYFSMHYNLGIGEAEEIILRRWHKDDPVDPDELIRHEKIAKYQKVRNPFIDHPEIVDRIGNF